jgi:hypothetical protein
MRLEADAGTSDVVDDLSDLLTLEHRNSKWTWSFNLVTEAEIAEPPNGYALEAFPEDFVAWVQRHPNFQVEGVMTVEVDEGTQIDVRVTSDSQRTFLMLGRVGWNMVAGEEIWRFIELDVSAERLLVFILSPTAEAIHLADVPEVEAIQDVLDSVEFLPS